MVTIGADFHLRTTTMTVLNNNGNLILRKKVDNDPAELRAFINQCPGPKQFAMETCYSWPVMYDLLQGEVDKFILLHAKKLRSIVESQAKCDGHDSDEIAKLTHAGYIPRAWAASPQTRQFRMLLRTRIGLSAAVTQLKNRIHAIVNSRVFYSQRPESFKDLFCKRGRSWLAGINFPEHERFLINSLLGQIDSFEKLKASFDQRIESIDTHNQELKLLSTIPAMKGKMIAYIVLAETDNISRFRNSDAFVAYAGIIPKDCSSGSKNRKGRLRTDCNQFLKWALIQAVIPAMRKDPALRREYQTVKARSNASAARIVIARKLARVIYHVLKEQRPYYTESSRG